MNRTAAAFLAALLSTLLLGSAGGLLWIIFSAQSHAPNAAPAGEIARHPFWRAEMTAGDVERVVGTIRDQKGYAVVYVDDHGRTFVCGTPESARRALRLVYEGRALEPPEGLGPRFFRVEMRDWSSRPSRDEVLSALRRRLDAADFYSRD